MRRGAGADTTAIERTRGFRKKVGDLETEQHRDALAAIAIDRPVCIAGIARSGSTILLEMLSRHPDVRRRRASHTEAVERAHKDRIKVTPSSPGFYAEERALITEITRTTAARLGYGT